MGSNSGYTVNDDGTVTKTGGGKRPVKPGGKRNGSGCLWAVVTLFALGALIAFLVAKTSEHDAPAYTPVETAMERFPDEAEEEPFEVEVEEVEEEPVEEEVVEEEELSPRATIERVWMEHNVYRNDRKGMLIHVRANTLHMLGSTVYCHALFYWADNITPLHDPYGDNLSFSASGTVNYDNCIFEDFQIFVPYSGLNMEPGQGTVGLSFDISFRDSSGRELDRKNNTTFNFTN